VRGWVCHGLLAILAACSYDAPPEVLPPQFFAIHPSFANAGDTIRLEGTFSETTLVEFPGGVTQSATVHGAHRASVVVPDSAGDGELFVMTGNARVGPVAFHLVKHGPDLQAFKPAKPLTVPRFNASAIVVGPYLYVMGGFIGGLVYDTIERAEISDGTLGEFQQVSLRLDNARWRHTAVTAGGEHYLLGGDDDERSVERTRVFSDGTLEPFQAVGSLVHNHGGATSEVIGDRLYVLAGSTLDVEYASLQDGMAASFQVLPGLDVLTPGATQRRFAASAVIDDSLCLFGGNSENGIRRSIVCAQIAADGSLGTFESQTPRISAGEDPLDKLLPNASSVVVGRHLYLFGGDPSPSSNAVFRIPLDGADRFKLIPQPPLITAREAAAVAVVGNSICVIGGEDDLGASNRVECAPFAPLAP
jgi:hypothetical protein